MSSFQRIENFLIGLVMLFCGGYMMFFPKEGYKVAALFLSIALVGKGLSYLFYFFSMARHMVGGKLIFFLGLILLDFGLFTLSLSDIPRVYVISYLLIMHAFSGIIELLRGVESKQMDSSTWFLYIFHGLVNIGIVVFCMFFVKSTRVLGFVYGIGLFYSAIIRMVSSFRQSQVMHIS